MIHGPSKKIRKVEKFSVSHHCRYKRGEYREKVYISIALVWILSVSFLSSLLITSNLLHFQLVVYDTTTCYCQLGDWKHLDIAFYIRDTVFMYLPLLVNLTLYTIVVVHLRSSKKRFRSMHGYLILLRFAIICVLFTVSWLPHVIRTFLSLSMNINHTVFLASQLALYMNCVTDPIMYTLPNKVLLACFKNKNNFINEKKTFSSLERRRSTAQEITRAARQLSMESKTLTISGGTIVCNSSAM